MISGMVVVLVQKPSDAVGAFAFAKPILITDVWYGSGGSVTVTGMIRMSFLCGETCAKYDTFFLLFGILNISQVMRSPVVLYGMH